MIDDIRRPDKKRENTGKINSDIFKASSDSKPEETPQVRTVPGDIDTIEVPDEPDAETEQVIDDAANELSNLQDGSKKPKKKFFWKKWSKKKKIITLVVAAALLIGGSTAAYVALSGDKPEPKKTVKAVVEPEPKPEPIYSNLSGLEITDTALNSQPVTAVMIENSRDARPQSGLTEAGVVFEAIAEGGITRFMALYQDNQPDYVGPIRSARPYYVQWLAAYDAGYAHVGGSPEALQNIRSWHIKDLDQFSNSGSYNRITSRYAPHNVYSSIPELVNLQKKKGYEGSNFTGFERKDDTKAAEPNASTINLNISSQLYNVQYNYDPASNSYKRNLAGVAHNSVTKDGTTTQISPKVVIAITTPYSIHRDGVHSQYNVLGSGSATIFQDGTAIAGTWHKETNTSPLTFKDTVGNLIKLNRGQAWVTAVASSDKVQFTP